MTGLLSRAHPAVVLESQQAAWAGRFGVSRAAFLQCSRCFPNANAARTTPPVGWGRPARETILFTRCRAYEMVRQL
jgi:hypothetical protein